MGKTQRAVADLFSQSIAESAAAGPTIVLLDEVETLAADRAKLSLEANPVDVHRATDAVLVQLDMLAERNPHLLFVATSNFPQAVDSAFLSRCDMVMEVPLPGKDACKQILVDCLNGLAKTFPGIGKLSSAHQFDACAGECVGLDGRAIRKRSQRPRGRPASGYRSEQAFRRAPAQCDTTGNANAPSRREAK